MQRSVFIALIWVACTKPSAKEDRREEPLLGPPQEVQPVYNRGIQGDAVVDVNTVGEEGCDVHWRDDDVGLAPVFRHFVRAGHGVIDVRCPDGKGYRQELDLIPGELKRVVVQREMYVPIKQLDPMQ